MRYIITLKLDDGRLINIIADEAKDSIKPWYVKHCKELFNGRHELWISSKTEITKEGKWSQDKTVTRQQGTRRYSVAFYLNDVPQLIEINAAGIKSAYNNVKIKYGIDETITMVVFEETQKISEKSKKKVEEKPKKVETTDKNEEVKQEEKVEERKKTKEETLELAKSILKSKTRTLLIISKTIDKIKITPELMPIAKELKVVTDMFTERAVNVYKNLPTDKAFTALNVFMYFLDRNINIEYAVNNYSNMSDLELLTYLCLHLRKEIAEYTESKKEGSDTDKKNKKKSTKKKG